MTAIDLHGGSQVQATEVNDAVQGFVFGRLAAPPFFRRSPSLYQYYSIEDMTMSQVDLVQ
jgi:hypothetical protein